MQAAINLDWHFTNERDLLKRYKIASNWGFTAIETANPYVVDAEQISDILAQNALKQVLINSRDSLACRPEKRKEFEESLEQSIHYAKMLNCKR